MQIEQENKSQFQENESPNSNKTSQPGFNKVRLFQWSLLSNFDRIWSIYF